MQEGSWTPPLVAVLSAAHREPWRRVVASRCRSAPAPTAQATRRVVAIPGSAAHDLEPRLVAALPQGLGPGARSLHALGGRLRERGRAACADRWRTWRGAAGRRHCLGAFGIGGQMLKRHSKGVPPGRFVQVNPPREYSKFAPWGPLH